MSKLDPALPPRARSDSSLWNFESLGPVVAARRSKPPNVTTGSTALSSQTPNLACGVHGANGSQFASVPLGESEDELTKQPIGEKPVVINRDDNTNCNPPYRLKRLLHKHKLRDD